MLLWRDVVSASKLAAKGVGGAAMSMLPNSTFAASSQPRQTQASSSSSTSSRFASPGPIRPVILYLFIPFSLSLSPLPPPSLSLFDLYFLFFCNAREILKYDETTFCRSRHEGQQLHRECQLQRQEMSEKSGNEPKRMHTGCLLGGNESMHLKGN